MRRATTLAVAVLAMMPLGCSRRHHRAQADAQAAALITQKGGHIDGGSIYPAADSRLFDPFSSDCPPMPPDDPTSHALMHCVDGKRGGDWDQNGLAGRVESDSWINTLPRDDDGQVRLDLRDAVFVARTNSRDYQSNLETLYRSALNVSFERFRFDSQFFAGTNLTDVHRGSDIGGSSRLQLQTAAGASRLTATGGEIVTGIANTLVWDLWGPNTDVFSSAIDFSLVQPLLRFGGRKRVLEQLTQSERDLLANVRQMEQYRQGFYVDIVTGRGTGDGPSLSGNAGQRGLGLIARSPSGRNGVASAGGYLGILQDQRQIRNQTTNITALRDSLAQLEALFDANRIGSRLQVDQARQALLNAQSSLLADRAAYDTQVDAFKIELGLPPELPVKIEDSLLNNFEFIDPDLTALQDRFNEVWQRIRSGRDNATDDLNRWAVKQFGDVTESIHRRIRTAEVDLANLQSELPRRRQQMQVVRNKVESLNADVDARVLDEKRLNDRSDYLRTRIPALGDELAKLGESQDRIMENLETGDVEESWKEINAHASKLSDLMLELSLVQAEARLQGITLLPLDLDARQAVQMARVNRLDWMNARAHLVDSWRKIEFFANELQSDLDLTVSGNLGTRPDNVLDFRSDRSQLRFGLRFDSPVNRLAQRNRYRIALLNYQAARRDYTLFEDQVSQSLRNTLRLVTLSQINLEVRRAAVQVAIAQVDNARLRLNPPPKDAKATRSSPPPHVTSCLHFPICWTHRTTSSASGSVMKCCVSYWISRWARCSWTPMGFGSTPAQSK